MLTKATVLGSHTRKFRDVFIEANNQLRDVFGMEMVELPNKEKTSVKQKRGEYQTMMIYLDAKG